MENLAGQTNKTRILQIDDTTGHSGTTIGNSGVHTRDVSGSAVITGTLNYNVYSESSSSTKHARSRSYRLAPNRFKQPPSTRDTPQPNASTSHSTSPGAIVSSKLKLSDYDPARVLWTVSQHKCPQTTEWILQNHLYSAWTCRRSSQCLWLTGIIGSGKSILVTTIVNHLVSHNVGNRLVAHFFFRENYKAFLSPSSLQDSYIAQILQHLQQTGRTASIPHSVKDWLRRLYGTAPELATFEEILDHVFLPLCNFLGEAVFIVDGLDICSVEHRWKIAKLFKALLKVDPRISVLIASREDVDIASSIAGSDTITIRLYDVLPDIKTFIDWKVKNKLEESRITDQEDTIEMIKERLAKKADKMILWVSLQIDAIWDSCKNDAAIRKAIDDLPENLRETYARCLKRMDQDQKQLATKILSWMCVAITPFSMMQLRQALAIDTATGEIDNSQMLTEQTIKRSCRNLIASDIDATVHFAHESVRKFLTDGTKDTLSLYPSGWNPSLAHQELGSLCIWHLSISCLSVTRMQDDIYVATKTHLHPMINDILANQPKPFWSALIPSARKYAVAATETSMPPKQPQKEPQKQSQESHPTFFLFACQQWVHSSRHFSLDPTSAIYTCLKNVALQPRVMPDVRPWQILISELGSSETALLGWSIANDHGPLFALVKHVWASQKPHGVLGKPLLPLGGLNVLQLALRSGNTSFLDDLMLMADFQDLTAEDVSQRDLLWHAVDSQNDFVIQKLLGRGVTAKPVDQEGSAFALAIQQGSLELIQDFKPRWNKAKIRDWVAAIQMAITHGQIAIFFELLHAQCPKIGITPKLNPNVVEQAAEHGHLDMLWTIWEERRTLSWIPTAPWPAVALAVASRDLSLKLLLEICSNGVLQGLDYVAIIQTLIEKKLVAQAMNVLNLSVSQNVEIPAVALQAVWIKAGQWCNLELIRSLEQLSTGPAAKKHLMQQLLYNGIVEGRTGLVIELLELGLITMCSSETEEFWQEQQTSPLLLAYERERFTIMAILIRRGAPTNWLHYNDLGINAITVLHQAARQNVVELVDCFLDQGDIPDTQGNTALMIAIGARSWESASRLAEYGADFTTAILIDDFNNDSYDEQSFYDTGHKELIAEVQAALSTRRYDWTRLSQCIDASDSSGRTHLHRAISSKCPKLVRWLIRIGTDVNAPMRLGSEFWDRPGDRPIHMAILSESYSLVDVLLSTGLVELHRKDSAGRTLYQMGIQCGAKHIRARLAEAGVTEDENEDELRRCARD